VHLLSLGLLGRLRPRISWSTNAPATASPVASCPLAAKGLTGLRSCSKVCMACGRPVTEASSNGVTCCRVVLQPIKPAYDPQTQSDTPKVFISYRHADCETLAADI
jgi:hypothetical protein